MRQLHASMHPCTHAPGWQCLLRRSPTACACAYAAALWLDLCSKLEFTGSGEMAWASWKTSGENTGVKAGYVFTLERSEESSTEVSTEHSFTLKDEDAGDQLQVRRRCPRRRSRGA